MKMEVLNRGVQILNVIAKRLIALVFLPWQDEYFRNCEFY